MVNGGCTFPYCQGSAELQNRLAERKLYVQS